MSVMDTEHRLHEGDRVRIRDTVDPSLYMGMSTLYNEGVVTKVREDRFGLPQVYIEWDKNHWSYNGAPDCWTFEEHFDILVHMSQEKPSKRDTIAALLAQLLDDEETPTSAPSTPPKIEPRKAKSDALRQRLDTLLPSTPELDITTDEPAADDPVAARAKATATVNEIIEDAEAYILIAVNRVDHPKAENGVLIPHAMTFSVNPVAELLATVHMSGLSTQAYQDLVLQAIGGGSLDNE